MPEITGLELKIEDMSDDVLKELATLIPKAMYAAGLTAQAEIVDYMSRVDATGRDIVDTGRLRGSISFITQNAEGAAVMQVPENTSSDTIRGRADEGEVIIGSNVEYAAYVNTGTTKQPARQFMERGIIDNSDKIQQVFTDVLEGKK